VRGFQHLQPLVLRTGLLKEKGGSRRGHFGEYTFKPGIGSYVYSTGSNI